jgi:uncharacterized protein
MNQTEHQLIDDLFLRLRDAEHQRRDPEVEQLIHQRLREQPGAVYAMAQTIIVQQQALDRATRLLENQQGQSGAQSPMGVPSGFRQSEEPMPRNRMGVPRIGREAQQGGGFLANAAQVAVGAAGGVLLGNAISSLWSGTDAAQSVQDAGGAVTDAADTASQAVEGATEEGSGFFSRWFGGGEQASEPHADQGVDTAALDDFDAGDW